MPARRRGESGRAEGLGRRTEYAAAGSGPERPVEGEDDPGLQVHWASGTSHA